MSAGQSDWRRQLTDLRWERFRGEAALCERLVFVGLTKRPGAAILTKSSSSDL